MRKEILRQLIHASGIFIIFLERFFDPLILIGICIAIIIWGEIIYRIDKFRHIFLFSTILRRCRRDKEEKGFIYFFIGVLFALVLFNFNIYIANAAIIILVLGDAASTIIGKKFGRVKLPSTKNKTLEGSLAFFLVGLAGATTQLPLVPTMVGTFLGALAEAYSPIDDNLIIPIVAGIGMGVVIYSI
jgi:dolichol kinase